MARRKVVNPFIVLAMKHWGQLILLSGLVLVGCGKKDEAGDKKDEAAANGPDKDKDKPAAEVKAKKVTCSEANKVEVAWHAEEMYTPGEFTHTHSIGFLSGMVFSGKTLYKIGYLVLANYDVKLGSYMIEMPKEEGQQAILIKFKTKTVPTVMETNKADYAKLSLATGEQKQAPGDEAGFDVSYFVAGESGGPGLSNSNSKGTATLTTAEGALCGSIDFTSPKGSTFKGSFNAQILKDLWAK